MDNFPAWNHTALPELVNPLGEPKLHLPVQVV